MRRSRADRRSSEGSVRQGETGHGIAERKLVALGVHHRVRRFGLTVFEAEAECRMFPLTYLGLVFMALLAFDVSENLELPRDS